MIKTVAGTFNSSFILLMPLEFDDSGLPVYQDSAYSKRYEVEENSDTEE